MLSACLQIYLLQLIMIFVSTGNDKWNYFSAPDWNSQKRQENRIVIMLAPKTNQFEEFFHLMIVNIAATLKRISKFLWSLLTPIWFEQFEKMVEKYRILRFFWMKFQKFFIQSKIIIYNIDFEVRRMWNSKCLKTVFIEF